MDRPTTHIPIADLVRQHAEVSDALWNAIRRVVESGRFILGAEVAALEKAMADLVGARHAIACASGSDAITLVLQALGVGPGDEVICPPFTFFATAGAARRIGAVPVFADLEPDGFGVDPAAIRAKIGPRTRAIIPVHLFGESVDWDPIAAVAEERGIPLVEDAAQSIGACYKGRPTGGLGRAAIFSFFPTKNLGALGDAGLITTSDDALANDLRLLRVHGDAGGYEHVLVGWNSRLDEIQAACLLAKLPRLQAWNDARRRNAAFYDEALAGLPLATPPRHADRPSIYHQYTIRTPRRDDLKAHLAGLGIGTGVYYPKPLHLQRCFQDLGGRSGDCPRAEEAARTVLSLPVHPQLARPEVEAVAAAVRRFFHG